MAYTTINKSTDYFDTKLHNGNATAKTLAYDFEVDMFWTKMRNDAYPHNVYDSVRGADQQLRTNVSNSSRVAGNTVSFGNSSGVSLGTDSGNYGTNKTQTDGGSQATYVGWGWKAGGTGSSNTDGTITSTVSVNTTAGFSIVKYVGNTVAGATVGHGLGAVPSVIMIKQTTGSTNWTVYHKGLGSHAKYLYLDASNGETTDSGNFDNVPTSSTFLLGSNSGVNAASGSTYIAYCFAEKTGFSKFGKLISNGNDSGSFCYTGFAPKWVMLKPNVTDGWSNWYIFDTTRDHPQLNDMPLYANLTTQEGYYGGSPASNYAQIDLLSNGFKIRRDGNWGGGSSGRELIYMAFGQSIVGSNNVPATAR